jgi:AAA15 family ATPase/GTPase
MLLQFAFENYRSFAGREVLSLLAVPGEEHPKGQVVEVPGVGPVLRSVVLYGPNASGKSSLFRAFQTAIQVAVDGIPAAAEFLSPETSCLLRWPNRQPDLSSSCQSTACITPTVSL